MQAGSADGVVGYPQPLGADRQGAPGRRWRAAVGDEVSRVHVPVVNHDGHQAVQVHGGAEGHRRKARSAALGVTGRPGAAPLAVSLVAFAF